MPWLQNYNWILTGFSDRLFVKNFDGRF